MCDMKDEINIFKDGEPSVKKTKQSIQVNTGFQWNLQALAEAVDAVKSGRKSPVPALNELGIKVNYNLLGQEGPAHCLIFKVAVTVASDMSFEGWGHSKKEARASAARACLAALLARARSALPAPTSHQGFTRDEPLKCPATSLLSHDMRFTVARTINDQKFEGFLPQSLANHIGNMVNEKFNEVMGGDLIHLKKKVLAGIVITIDNRVDGSKVIAATTGTKCVSGEHMSVNGRALNDCHAEVAARRCLQRHLYAQLLMYAVAKDPLASIPESDIEPVPTGGYQLKPNRQVHLYVSTAPCGDGRIFSPNELPEPDRHPNRLARGQLRTKIESGEGTIPVKNFDNLVQTWDGVMQGERLLTMSCSDKVARWCVLGLQGALLAKILKPVYLHSLVLGSMLHPHHMNRAISGRIKKYIVSLPPPYKAHRPLLARAASSEAKTIAKAPSFSVCWCSTTPLPEIVNAATGKLEGGLPSLLCKQSMFARWHFLVKRLRPLAQESYTGLPIVAIPEDVDNLLYNEAKLLCPEYQAAKEILTQAFEKAKLGRWVKKPLEQDQFICEIIGAHPSILFV